MKLSEAILLGSTVVTPKAGALRFSGQNAGCALGMAAIASGCTFSPPEREIPVKDLRTLNVEDIWDPGYFASSSALATAVHLSH